MSKKEQKARLLERLENPRKFWKFSVNDVKEREYWGDYMDAYETMIRRTATKRAPWYVVPADSKWFTRAVVGAAIVDGLGDLDLDYPEVDPKRQEELGEARKFLEKK